jgi:hypothetical protein
MPQPRCLLPILILLVSACGPDPAEREQFAVAALRTEVPALQKAFHAANGRYANHIRELTGGADTLASGVRVIIHGADEDGWSASSSHPAIPGAACAAWVGDPWASPSLTGNVGPRTAGEVSCIAFGPWKKNRTIERSGPYAMTP